MKIETGIDIPKIRGRGRKLSYPLDQMEVGQSIFFTDRTEGLRAYNAARAYGHRHGLWFKSATMDGGLRIWRMA